VRPRVQIPGPRPISEYDPGITAHVVLNRATVSSCTRPCSDGDGTAMDENEWWATSGPLLSRVLDETAYPIAARIGSAAGAAHGSAYSSGHAYTFGLERVLAGLSQLIDSN
jgi:hypothetical protein